MTIWTDVRGSARRMTIITGFSIWRLKGILRFNNLYTEVGQPSDSFLRNALLLARGYTLISVVIQFQFVVAQIPRKLLPTQVQKSEECTRACWEGGCIFYLRDTQRNVVQFTVDNHSESNHGIRLFVCSRVFQMFPHSKLCFPAAKYKWLLGTWNVCTKLLLSNKLLSEMSISIDT